MMTRKLAFLRLLALSWLLALPLLMAAQSQSKEELEKRRRQIETEIQQLQAQQNELSRNKKTSVAQLNLVQSRLRSRFAIIDNLNDELRLIDETIFTNNREIYRLRKHLDTLRSQYARTLEYSYKNRSSHDMLNFLFTSTSFNDAFKRAAYLKSYRQYREDQARNIMRTSAELQATIGQLSQNKAEKNNALQEQNRQKEILEEEKQEKARVVNDIKARERDLSKELTAKRKTLKDLSKSIQLLVQKEIDRIRLEREAEARKLREAAALANKGNVAGAGSGKTVTTPATGKVETPATGTTPTRKSAELENTPEVTRVSVGFENNRRNIPWPVDVGTVTSGFGRRKIEGTSLYEENIGVTIQTKDGQAVKAVFEGIVTSVFDVDGSATVTIQHGKYFTTYYNLSVVSVAKGARVSMGQSIGKAGLNDYGDGEIIFVVNIEKEFVDPMNWLKPR
jgi:septal ring factor EnvC (AmiA/AmiB activator)